MKERIIRCKIEMDMIEGEHFNLSKLPLDNTTAIFKAIRSFLDTVNQLDNSGDLEEYVQTELLVYDV